MHKFYKRNDGDRAYNTDKYIYKQRNSIKFKVDLTITSLHTRGDTQLNWKSMKKVRNIVEFGDGSPKDKLKELVALTEKLE